MSCEHDAPEWQAAIEALMLVVDLGGPTMFARIASASRNCTGHEAMSCRCMPLIFGVYFRLNLMTI